MVQSLRSWGDATECVRREGSVVSEAVAKKTLYIVGFGDDRADPSRPTLHAMFDRVLRPKMISKSIIANLWINATLLDYFLNLSKTRFCRVDWRQDG